MTDTRATESNWLERLQPWKQKQKEKERKEKQELILGCIGLFLAYLWRSGQILAICISWSEHKSIFSALIHGSLSWAYVIYHWMFQK